MRLPQLAGACLLALALAVASRAAAGELSGTAWRLVQITPPDEAATVPDDGAKYTLEFGADGGASVLADCNRGMGSWEARSAGELRFGPVAATRAVCPPGSLSEKYLAQFEAVRGYAMRDGHLLLATGAGGAIMELAPTGVAPLAATVLGEEVRTADAAVMQDFILTRLFDRYAAEQGIRAEPAEIEAFVEVTRRGMTEQDRAAEQALTPGEAAEVAAMRQSLAEAVIRQWKISRALHAQYGGRIVYQQLGPEPLDAYRLFLEQREREGAFVIHDKALTGGFWDYFTNEARHDFMESGSADEARAFAVPPWEPSP